MRYHCKISLLPLHPRHRRQRWPLDDGSGAFLGVIFPFYGLFPTSHRLSSFPTTEVHLLLNVVVSSTYTLDLVEGCAPDKMAG
jgi:hypothetical protein